MIAKLRLQFWLFNSMEPSALLYTAISVLLHLAEHGVYHTMDRVRSSAHLYCTCPLPSKAAFPQRLAMLFLVIYLPLLGCNLFLMSSLISSLIASQHLRLHSLPSVHGSSTVPILSSSCSCTSPCSVCSKSARQMKGRSRVSGRNVRSSVR